MKLSKKYIAGMAAVAVATAYSLTRWRGNSKDMGEQTHTTEDQTPAAN